YQIGPNDILKIAVFGNDDLSQTVLVQPDGTFMYPLVGRVKASDMAPKELERKLAVLLGNGYIRNPPVTVTVQEARSRSEYVLGEVRAPGGFAPPVGATVEQMILLAGGFTDRASQGNIRLAREVDGKKQDRKAKGSDPIFPGDVITVKAKLF